MRVKSLVLESTGPIDGIKVDVEKGIIYGAKYLGKISLNMRRYGKVIKSKRHLYEGASVFIDHVRPQAGRKKGAARSVKDWGGVIRNTRVGADEDGYCDIHVLKETPAGRLLLEAAVKAPKNFGLSPLHVVEVTKGPDGWEDVEDILEVRSVDVVTRPATTTSLFEDIDMADTDMAVAPVAQALSIEDAFVALQNSIMASSDLDDTERIAVLKDVMKLKGKVLGGGDEEEPAEGEGPPAAESVQNETPPPPARVRPRDRLRKLELRQLCYESQVEPEESLLEVLLPLDDKAAKAHLDFIKKGRKRPYTTGGARSGARTSGIAAEEVQALDGARGARSGARGQKGKAPPLLSAGAKREDVLAHYRSRN